MRGGGLVPLASEVQEPGGELPHPPLGVVEIRRWLVELGEVNEGFWSPPWGEKEHTREGEAARSWRPADEECSVKCR